MIEASISIRRVKANIEMGNKKPVHLSNLTIPKFYVGIAVYQTLNNSRNYYTRQ